MQLTKTHRFLIWAAYTILIAFLSLSPSRTFDDIPSFSYEDLLVHFVIYAIYAIILLWAWQPDIRRHPLMPVTVMLICVSYGILMENLQPIVQPHDRTFSWLDITANTLGAFSASAIWIKAARRRTTKPET